MLPANCLRPGLVHQLYMIEVFTSRYSFKCTLCQCLILNDSRQQAHLRSNQTETSAIRAKQFPTLARARAECSATRYCGQTVRLTDVSSIL